MECGKRLPWRALSRLLRSFRIEFFDGASGYARHQGIGRHITVDDRAGCDDGSLADRDAREDRAAGAEPGPILDHHGHPAYLDRTTRSRAGVRFVRAGEDHDFG